MLVLFDAHVHLYMGDHDMCIPGAGLPVDLVDHPDMRVLKSFEHTTHMKRTLNVKVCNYIQGNKTL